MLGSIIYKQQAEVNQLELNLLSAQSTITQQENKIKEQLTEINLLVSDLEVRDKAVSALQYELKEIKEDVDNLLNNMTSLESISAVGQEIIINKNQDEVNVVDHKTGKDFINLRNNIVTSYR